MLVDVLLMLDELVAHRLLQIGALAAEIGQFVDDVFNEMKAVDLVLHAHIERRRDRAFFLVATDMQIAIGSAVGQSVDQGRISVEPKDDRLILGEERVVVRFAQSMRMLRARLKPHQIDDIDHPNFQIGQILRRIETAARTSSIGVSPQPAITTSGSLP